jgi:carbamoyltransferase
MLLVAPARPGWRERIPNVVHCDGSCRIQTVSAESDPLFYALLRAFERRTDIPMLLNTSFNCRRMPIVETPMDAIDFFLACELDVLVLDVYVVRKNAEAAKRKPAGDERHSRAAMAPAYRPDESNVETSR